MIEVTKLYARSFDLDHIDLFWEIAPLAFGDADEHQVYDFDTYILRSGDSALGPFETLGGPYTDIYHFRDSNASQLHKWRQYFYKLKIVRRSTGEEKLFGPSASLEAEPDLIASEIIRQEDVLFREFIGRKCWLYPARSFGPLCSCFDPILGRVTRSSHLSCFGTGFLGGFMYPVEVFLQFDPSPKTTNVTALQEVQQSDTIARMISFPPVSPKDILIESENRRWRVLNVTQTQRLRAVVHQELRLHEIPRGDIEYDLPVKVDTRYLTPSAERNFTNPQNLTSNEDYGDIFAAFGHPRGALR